MNQKYTNDIYNVLVLSRLGRECCMANSKDCKVKKVATLSFLYDPPFSGLFPLSNKIFGTPQVAQFLEGPTPSPF